MVSQSWAWIWYTKSFTVSGAKGQPRVRALWLCPDCAGEFSSDRARDAFLRRSLGEPDD